MTWLWWTLFTAALTMTAIGNVFITRFVASRMTENMEDDVVKDTRYNYKLIYIHIATWLLMLAGCYMIVFVGYAAHVISLEPDESASATLWDMMIRFNAAVSNALDLSLQKDATYTIVFVVVYMFTLMFMLDTGKMQWIHDEEDDDETANQPPLASYLLVAIVPSIPLLFKSRLVAPLLQLS